jgi:hypothetical protein
MLLHAFEDLKVHDQLARKIFFWGGEGVKMGRWKDDGPMIETSLCCLKG